MPVIGVVRTRYRSMEETPIQAGLNRGEHATVDIDPAYQDGLDGLAGFDYGWLLTWLHHRDDPIDRPLPLRQTPFLLRGTGRQLGVFATRGPRRVNPIGLSLVRILGVAEHRVAFAGVDLLDGTPVLDLKPYVTTFDRPPGNPACGWFDDVTMVEGITPAALAAVDPASGENPPGSRGS
jgi:tRNA-Thr(GGU) m(6)t(6)A37 methyltransferase TsaA